MWLGPALVGDFACAVAMSALARDRGSALGCFAVWAAVLAVGRSRAAAVLMRAFTLTCVIHGSLLKEALIRRAPVGTLALSRGRSPTTVTHHRHFGPYPRCGRIWSCAVQSVHIIGCASTVASVSRTQQREWRLEGWKVLAHVHLQRIGDCARTLRSPICPDNCRSLFQRTDGFPRPKQ